MKLEFELVPETCFYVSLRSVLLPNLWDIVRREAYARAGGRCMICGAPQSRLEAHEVWSYDEASAVRKLENVVAICRDCHETIHIGRTQLKGDAEKAERHYMKVNGVSYAEMRKAMGEANEAQRRRNKIDDWKLDLSYLKKFTK